MAVCIPFRRLVCRMDTPLPDPARNRAGDIVCTSNRTAYQCIVDYRDIHGNMATPVWARIAAILSLSYLIQEIAFRPLSDLLFICLCLWFLHMLDIKQSLGMLIPLASLASLVRYAGITLIATGVIVLVWRREWRRAVWFTILSSLPLGLWLLRNWIATGTLVGPRLSSPFEWQVVVSDYLGILITWFIQTGSIFGGCYVVDRVFRRLQRLHNL